MLPIQRKISPYNHYKGNDIKYIVIHYIGATGTAKNNADYFYGGDRQASAHYFIGDTECWQSVEDFNGAWHVGNTRTEVNNKNSIGIEMECANAHLNVTTKTEDNTVELVVHLMKKYNIPIENVRTHYEVSGKTKLCPNFANTSRWTNMKNKIKEKLSGANTTQTTTEIYRIRKTWADVMSQKGAFANKDSAIAECKKYSGYCVFDSKGNQVYPTVTNTTTTTTSVIYRVKDSKGTQLGAFSKLDNAKALAQEKKAIVYDENNKVIISYVPVASNEKTYSEKGTFYFTTAVTVRTAMEENAKTTVVYYSGESVQYHTVTLNKNGYNWIHYARSNGQTGYLKIKDLATGESYGYAK